MPPPPNISDIDAKLLDGLQFCTIVYQLFESIRQSKDGKSRLRMRAGDTEKKLVEELLPISKYVQIKHGPGRYISMKWLNGNQQYDAEMHQFGWFIEHDRYPAVSHIEVTCVVHQNDYLMRELIDTKGFGFGIEGVRRDSKTRKISSEPHVWSNLDYVDSFCPLVLDGIKKKAEKGYPADTVLIVACSLNTVYLLDEWEALTNKIRAGLPNFNFREIFVFDVCSDLFCSFYGPHPRDSSAS